MQFCSSENFQVFNCCLLPEESRCTACDIQATPRRTASAGWSANRTVSWKYSSDGSWYRCGREWAPSAPARRRSPWCWTCPSGRGAETRQTCLRPNYCLYHQRKPIQGPTITIIIRLGMFEITSSPPSPAWPPCQAPAPCSAAASSCNHSQVCDPKRKQLSSLMNLKSQRPGIENKKSLPAISFYDEQLLSDP